MPASQYMMVLPARHFRIDANRVALESAFAQHLRLLRGQIGAAAGQLLIVSPSMSAASFEAAQKGLEILDEAAESIRFSAPFSDDSVGSKIAKLKLAFPMLRSLWRGVRESFCVHSGLSWDWVLPFEFASIVFGAIQRRRTLFFVDIDYRNSARMSYLNGSWSRRSYLMCKYVYDSARAFQIAFAVRNCSLVLLKGKKLAEDFGRGRANVKDFLDAAHSASNIIDSDALEAKLLAIRDRSCPLRLTYFGRLTAYKGIDACLRAVAAARHAGALVTFDIIGGGEEADSLRELCRELGADEYVTFHGPRQFNQQFFEQLYSYHLLLAAPLREDTPRSALDAMAAGIPFLAFDTYYYKQFTESGAGEVVPWLDEKAMAASLIRLESDRDAVVRMVEQAVAFARLNTQEIWLERRWRWTQDSMLSRP